MGEFKELHHRLTTLRTERFGSRGRRKMAEELGISDSLYGRYEKNTTPAPAVLAKVAELCKVNLEWLISGKGPRKKEAYVEVLSQIPVRDFRGPGGQGPRGHTGVHARKTANNKVPEGPLGGVVGSVNNKEKIRGENVFAIINTCTLMEPTVPNGAFVVLNPDREPDIMHVVCYKMKNDAAMECALLTGQDEKEYHFIRLSGEEKKTRVGRKQVEWMHPVVGVY